MKQWRRACRRRRNMQIRWFECIPVIWNGHWFPQLNTTMKEMRSSLCSRHFFLDRFFLFLFLLSFGLASFRWLLMMLAIKWIKKPLIVSRSLCTTSKHLNRTITASPTPFNVFCTDTHRIRHRNKRHGKSSKSISV